MKVQLFDRNTQAPHWWDNFIEYHREFNWYKSINETLKPFGGKFRITFNDNGIANERWLEFEREEQYTWFILRWS